MEDQMNFAALLLLAESLAPGGAEFLNAIIQGTRALCQFLRSTSDEKNERLIQLLQALAVRVECEVCNERVATEGWATRYHSLCTRINTHVDGCATQGNLIAIFNSGKNAKKVTVFNDELMSLTTEVDTSFQKK